LETQCGTKTSAQRAAIIKKNLSAPLP